MSDADHSLLSSAHRACFDPLFVLKYGKDVLRDAGMVVYPMLRITEIFDYLLDRTVGGTVYVDGRIKAAFGEYLEEGGTRVWVYG